MLVDSALPRGLISAEEAICICNSSFSQLSLTCLTAELEPCTACGDSLLEVSSRSWRLCGITLEADLLTGGLLLGL